MASGVVRDAMRIGSPAERWHPGLDRRDRIHLKSRVIVPAQCARLPSPEDGTKSGRARRARLQWLGPEVFFSVIHVKSAVACRASTDFRDLPSKISRSPFIFNYPTLDQGWLRVVVWGAISRRFKCRIWQWETQSPKTTRPRLLLQAGIR